MTYSRTYSYLTHIFDDIFLAFRYASHMLMHEMGLATWNSYLIVSILIQELLNILLLSS